MNDGQSWGTLLVSNGLGSAGPAWRLLWFLTFIARLLSKGAVSIYKFKAVHFFQGLFLKLLKRNKILYGAGGPENV